MYFLLEYVSFCFDLAISICCCLGNEQATSYQRQLEMQKEELEHLLQERQRLLRVQQELTRISSKQEQQLQHKKSTTTQV